MARLYGPGLPGLSVLVAAGRSHRIHALARTLPAGVTYTILLPGQPELHYSLTPKGQRVAQQLAYRADALRQLEEGTR